MMAKKIDRIITWCSDPTKEDDFLLFIEKEFGRSDSNLFCPYLGTGMHPIHWSSFLAQVRLGVEFGAKEVVSIGHFDCKFYALHPPRNAKKDSLNEANLYTMKMGRRQLQYDFLLKVRLFFGRPLNLGGLKFESIFS